MHQTAGINAVTHDAGEVRSVREPGRKCYWILRSQALLTLFVVVDPIAMAPTFLVVTTGMPRGSRESVAVRASIIAGGILIGTALVGDRLLGVLEISLPAFRIAGGLLLFWIAAEMVFGVRSRQRG